MWKIDCFDRNFIGGFLLRNKPFKPFKIVRNKIVDNAVIQGGKNTQKSQKNHAKHLTEREGDAIIGDTKLFLNRGSAKKRLCWLPPIGKNLKNFFKNWRDQL